jgi:hypothetical protein
LANEPGWAQKPSSEQNGAYAELQAQAQADADNRGQCHRVLSPSKGEGQISERCCAMQTHTEEENAETAISRNTTRTRPAGIAKHAQQQKHSGTDRTSYSRACTDAKISPGRSDSMATHHRATVSTVTDTVSSAANTYTTIAAYNTYLLRRLTFANSHALASAAAWWASRGMTYDSDRLTYLVTGKAAT